MNKIIVFVSLIAISYWAVAFSVFAQEEIRVQEEITIKDLGVENPGILPTSPLYFLKEWRRGIKKIFTFDPVKKTEMETEEVNERAAEIKRMEEVSPRNIEAITKAVENYQRNMERLRTRLENLKETSQNPNVDKLLDKLTERSLKHQQLFDNLKQKFEERLKLKEQLRAGQEKIDEVMTKIPEKFENAAAFEKRLERKIQKLPEGILKELRAVEVVDRIREKLPEQQQEKIQELKDKLIKKFENRIEKLGEAEKVEILEKIKSAPLKQQLKEKAGPILKREKAKERICIQVITPAISPDDGACKEFPTPCDVPSGWKKVNKCP